MITDYISVYRKLFSSCLCTQYTIFKQLWGYMRRMGDRQDTRTATTQEAPTDSSESPSFELVRGEFDETHSWEFMADVRVRLHNPRGEDVAALHTYRFGPKHDRLVADDQAVHQTTRWWFSTDRPADGDRPFWDQALSWGYFEDPDHDELLEECVNEDALYDPEASLDALQQNVRDNSQAKSRLTKNKE